MRDNELPSVERSEWVRRGSVYVYRANPTITVPRSQGDRVFGRFAGTSMTPEKLATIRKNIVIDKRTSRNKHTKRTTRWNVVRSENFAEIEAAFSAIPSDNVLYITGFGTVRVGYGSNTGNKLVWRTILPLTEKRSIGSIHLLNHINDALYDIFEADAIDAYEIQWRKTHIKRK